MIATMTLIALLQLAAEFASPHTVELFPAGTKTPPPGAITLARDQRLGLHVAVTAPADDSLVEDLHADGKEPNLVLIAERLGSDGKRHPARLRVVKSGGGQELRQHTGHFFVDILDTAEARRERILKFFGPVHSNDGAVAYMDNMYVANPPGEYRLTMTYRPKTGAFAGQTLERTVSVVVREGPDTLDRLAK